MPRAGSGKKIELFEQRPVKVRPGASCSYLLGSPYAKAVYLPAQGVLVDAELPGGGDLAPVVTLQRLENGAFLDVGRFELSVLPRSDETERFLTVIGQGSDSGACAALQTLP
ncbi:MAG TPA: hypothetical protein VFX82_07115 [Desulfobacterales bacterium]|nr:hypothetical protein [Desulfobacterales bacterium]